MLGNKEAVANLAVKDLDRAKQFYEEILGLTPIEAEGDDLIVFQSGVSTLNVYCSKYAGTNQATAVTWAVGDEIEALVSASSTTTCLTRGSKATFTSWAK
jgi:catechol 2,3-dioxygenase-like lactoylglutathione lyase family enzyme